MAPQKFRRPSLQYPLSPVFDFLRKTSGRLPAKVAIIDPQGRRELTFADIDRESDSLAETFFQWGVKKGDRISFFMPNGWEYFVGFYAAMKAGAVVSPLNPTYRQRELKHQVDDAESAILLTSFNLLPIVEGVLPELRSIERIIITRGTHKGGENIFVLADLLEKSSGQSSYSAPPLNPKEDLSTLPYSSGTAGLSKGAMITHFNLVSNTLQSMHAVEAREDDVFISFLPFHHIYGLTYFLCGAIYVGASQVIMVRFDAEECLRLIERYRVTVMFSVQPALLAFLNLPQAGQYDISSLRLIWAGAAPLAPAISRAIREKFGVPVARHYGLTEASPTTHANPSLRIKEGSVGIAVSDCQDRIVDGERGEMRMPLGEPGELVIRGPNVFQGYWKHPQDTKLALRDGWLYTGDIAKMDEEGYVYILDRKKEMIKYRGYQVAPAELEALLMEHPAVRDCAVVGIPDQASGEIPKAFIVLHEGKRVDPAELMAFVAERVAPYKKIREVTFIPEVPRNFSGKILRRVLKGG
jgi:acyl-CoA synthetase (AMP-forming)/AMP-acid ligase II